MARRCRGRRLRTFRTRLAAMDWLAHEASRGQRQLPAGVASWAVCRSPRGMTTRWAGALLALDHEQEDTMPHLRRKLFNYLPDGAHRLSTFQELREELRAFAGGATRFLVLLGPPGTGKTRAAESILGERVAWIRGSASPYLLYCDCYRARNRPIVIDEGEGILARPDGVSLFKLLSQTEAAKTVSWPRLTNEIRSGDIPKDFTTGSHILFITNGWPTENLHLDAVVDRATVLYFSPSAQQVHEYARQVGLLRDREIAEYVEARLGLLASPSLRVYARAAEAKERAIYLRKGDDYWQGYIDAALLDSERMLALELARDEAYRHDGVRAQEFSSQTGRDLSQFYRAVKDLIGIGLLPDADTRRELQKQANARNLTPERQIALDLCRDETYRSDQARAREFAKRTGMSLDSFQRYRKELMNLGVLPDADARREEQHLANARNLTPERRAALDLLCDKSFPTNKARAEEFQRRTGFRARAFYQHTANLRALGLAPDTVNGREVIDQQARDRETLVLQLMADKSLASKTERLRAFERLTGCRWRSFYKILDRLREQGKLKD